jgi:hypothetical protein
LHLQLNIGHAQFIAESPFMAQLAQGFIGPEIAMRRTHENTLDDKLIINGHDDCPCGDTNGRPEQVSSQYIQMLDKGHLFCRSGLYPSFE